MQIAEIDFCGARDLDAIMTIERACFDDPWEARVVENDLDNPGSIVYMKATLKDIVAAYAALSRGNRGNDICHLMNIAVLPEFRKMGLALQLMLALEEVAAEWENRRMRLEVRSSNRGAREFYSDLGFTYNSRLKAYYPDGEDALVLTARLPLKI